ncbi:MAG: glycosyltransferase family 4 protein [Bacteroidota bacterium]
MPKSQLIRITTVPLSLEKLLEGQLRFMSDHFDVVAISSERERLESYGKKEGVDTFHLRLTRKITPLKDIKAVIKLYRFLRRTKPLILHSHTPKAGIVGMLAAYFARVPVRLHTVAGLPLMEATGTKLRLLRWVEKWTYRCATQVYPNSKGLYEYILAERFTKPEKLKVIATGSSNGIDVSYFDPSSYSEAFRRKFRAELGIPNSDFVYIFVGRIVKDKGIHELVSAFQKLNKENQHSTLLLVGPLENDLDPLSDEISQLIKEHHKIRSVGYVDDVRPYFSISDVLTFVSYREGFPNVVMQAGAMGLPAIVSNINGCNEIIQEGKNGIIVPAKDTESLFLAMKTVLAEDNEFEKLKENARPMITDRYSRQEVWDALLAEYETLKEEL